MKPLSKAQQATLVKNRGVQVQAGIAALNARGKILPVKKSALVMAFAVALAAGSAKANCATDAGAQFEALREQAIKTYADSAQDLRRATFQVGTSPDGSNAVTLMDRKQTKIIFDTASCGYPEVHRKTIIAHELGHIVSWGSDKFKITFSLSYNVEQAANNYGARLLQESDRASLIVYLSAECSTETGDTYWCDRMASWKSAFVGADHVAAR